MNNTSRGRWIDAMVFICFLAIGLGLASPGLRAPFILDDQIRIVENLDIRSLKDLPSKLIYPYGPYPVYTRNDPSRPLVSLTYALNYHFGKLDPLGYHLFDVLAHVGVAFLVHLYLALIFRRLWLGSKSPLTPLCERGGRGEWLSLMVSLIFLCHPVLFGTVMYAYGRTDTLSAFFILLTMVLYTRTDSSRSTVSVCALASFVLALLAKESAVVVPIILMAQDLLVGTREEDEGGASRIKRWLPYLAVAALYVFGRWAYFGAIGDLVGGKNSWSRWDYASVQPYAVVQYIRLLLVPLGSVIDHFIQPSTLTVDDKVLGILTLLGLAVGVWKWYRSGDALGRGALYFLILFAVLLAPTSSLFPTVDALVERRLYPAAFGVIGIVALAWAAVDRRGFSGLRIASGVFVIVPLIALAGVTVNHNRMINDPAEVWKNVLETYPDSPRGLNNLAVVLQVRGKADEAFALYERLIVFNPNDYIAHMNLARIHENPASAHFDRERARFHYETSVQIEPAFADGHYNFGRWLQVEGDQEAAEKEYLRVLEINPDYVQAHNNLGLLHFRMGKRESAEFHIRRALELDPTYAPAQVNLQMLNSALVEPGR